MPLRVALTGLVGRAYSPPNLTNMDCRAIEVNACVERGTEIGIFYGVEYLEKCHGTYSMQKPNSLHNDVSRVVKLDQDRGYETRARNTV